jgi:hypothetical protein
MSVNEPGHHGGTSDIDLGEIAEITGEFTMETNPVDATVEDDDGGVPEHAERTAPIGVVRHQLTDASHDEIAAAGEAGHS